MSVDPRDQRIAELEQLLRAALTRISDLETEVLFVTLFDQDVPNSLTAVWPTIPRFVAQIPTGRWPCGAQGRG